MDRRKRRRRAREKARRQEDRKHPRSYQAESPVDMLRNFLPEASSDALAWLRREPERRMGILRRVRGWLGL